MKSQPSRRRVVAAAAASLAVLGMAAAGIRVASAADWPTWGGTPARNMVSAEVNLPATADAGKPKEDGDAIDPATTKNVKWVAKLGNQTYGNPTVAGGRVYVGTNNATPRDPKYAGDYGIVMCFEEASGKFLWQLAVPKLAGGKNVDWEEVGVCSSPTVDGDRVYVITNRCEVVCLDAHGLANGNQGVQDEPQYTAGPGKPPIPQGPADADVLWRYDMRVDLGVYPHYQASSAPLVVGDRVYASTSNSVDWTDRHLPAPDAPTLICLDKNTGKLLAEERSGVSSRTLYSNWSTPAFGTVAGKPTVVFGAGDGLLYGFDPEPAAGTGGAPGTLKELWRVDCNPPEHRAVKYRDSKGPSEIIATPVIHAGRVYVAVGQDPEHGDGVGAVNCVGEKDGKVDVLWRNTKVRRSMSTASVTDDLTFVADGTGFVHCLETKTGNELWNFDLESVVWGSTLLADGKVYIGNESGELIVLAAGREKKELGRIDFGSALYSTPVPANGVLYVATGTNLYALKQ